VASRGARIVTPTAAAMRVPILGAALRRAEWALCDTPLNRLAGFWIAANLAGLCMGSSQAAGRAIVGYLAPPARLAEFFGLWGLAVKAASIVGPLTYGAVTWLFAGNHRLAIFSTGLYFVVGLALLAGIDVERGRRQALAA
jgi:UMF1 family MFS transporter